MSESDDDSVTESSRARWEYLSSALALIYIPAYLALAFLVSMGYAQWPGGNGGGVVMTAFMLFVLYVVGPEAVKAYKEMKA